MWLTNQLFLKTTKINPPCHNFMSLWLLISIVVMWNS
jgi:hypothetical protein